jgi:hypothetical protein
VVHGRQSGLVELAAAGLRNVVVHDGSFGRRAGRLAAIPGVETLYRSRSVSAFRITKLVAPHHDAALLRLDGVALGHFEFKGYRYHVAELAVRNASPHVWALPHPVAPLGVRWRYVRPDGSAAGDWHEGTTMLPLALAGNATATIRATLARPPAGCDCAVEVEVPALGWHAVSPAPAT